jgi:IstB-like ATP binding protein
LESRRNVAVSTETGKTHIALGIGLAASGFYAVALVHELPEACDETRFLRLQRQVAVHKLLIIDELGYVPLSQIGVELLFENIETTLRARFARPIDQVVGFSDEEATRMLSTTLAAKGCRGFGYVGRKNDTAKKVAKALSALSTNWFRSWPYVSWGMPPIWIEPGGLLS